MPSVLETKLALISQQSKISNCHDKLHQWHISAEEDSEKINIPARLNFVGKVDFVFFLSPNS